MPSLIETPEANEETKHALLALIDEFTSAIIMSRNNRLENWKAMKVSNARK